MWAILISLDWANAAPLKAAHKLVASKVARKANVRREGAVVWICMNVS
jgi:hypothetical protein